MALILKHNEVEYHTDTIFWDRDSYFIDFNNYWSRLVGLIAQKIAENTTDNWNKFNLVRTQLIKVIGINLDTGTADESSPVVIFPTNTFPILLASSLKDILFDKGRNELSNLFQDLATKAFTECQEFLKKSILLKNLDVIKDINKKAKQILITNDFKENNTIFIKEAKIESYLFQSLTQVNKSQVDDLLKSNSFFITANNFLHNLYLKKGINNVLLVKDLSSLSFYESLNETIRINIDGASKGNPGKAGIGIAFYKNNELIDKISEFIGDRTNNFAEYTALIRALQISLEKGFQNIEIQSDSELVVNQINKKYKVKDADIKDLFDKAFSLIKQFSNIKIIHIPREENLRADKLANNAIKNNVPTSQQQQ